MSNFSHLAQEMLLHLLRIGIFIVSYIQLDSICNKKLGLTIVNNLIHLRRNSRTDGNIKCTIKTSLSG
jgi:hypothetical protein